MRQTLERTIARLSPGLVILALVWISSLHNAEALTVDGHFDGVANKRKVSTNPAQVLCSVSVQTQAVCVMKCAMVIKCGGVNYNAGTRACECLLESALSSLSLVDAAGWSFYEAAKVNTRNGERIFR